MFKKKIFSKFLVLALFAIPFLTFAESGSAGCGTKNESLKCLIIDFGDLITNYLVPLIFIGAFVYFIWGVANYISHGGDQTKMKEAKKFMLWGIIGLTVMFSVWGLIKILQNTANLNNDMIEPPTLDFKIN